MDFPILKRRFKQFGGLRLVLSYARLHVVGTIVREFCSCLVHRRSFKAIYPAIGRKVDGVLIERFLVDDYGQGPREQEASERCIWWSWLQGEDKAPEIVVACLASLRRNITDRELRIIDGRNWREYIDLPDYIVSKWEKGRIPSAMFSDILRLELLIRYGGTWIDSTVLCTADQSDDSCLMRQRMLELLDADLFVYQYTHPEGNAFGGCSNWFISAKAGSALLQSVRDSIYAYWREYDCVVEYYIFHRFFAELVRRHPDYIAAMPYGYSPDSLVLMHNWYRPYTESTWKKIVNRAVFHKLSFRVRPETLGDGGNLYYEILRRYNSIKTH